MFDIGFWEVAFIGLLGLLILGPKRLPEAARSAGQWVGKIRNFISNVKQDLDSQLQSDELAELRRLKDELVQARETLQQTSEGMVSSITAGVNEQMQEISPKTDFIDDAVSAPLPVKKKSTAAKKKPKRKNGKPAVAATKKVKSKKTKSSKSKTRKTKSKTAKKKPKVKKK